MKFEKLAQGLENLYGYGLFKAKIKYNTRMQT